jgi:hypothetical protein
MPATHADFALSTTASCLFVWHSLALTDHNFALETLRAIGRSMPERGGPSLPPEQEERLLATIRDPKLACHPDRGNDAGCNDGRRKQEGQRP